MHCIGCGDDISKIPSKRRSLCSDSVVDPGPRKQAQENPGRMCKPCFTQFWNYQNLLAQLEKKKLSLALQRFDLTDSKISALEQRIQIIYTSYAVDFGILRESPGSYIN